MASTDPSNVDDERALFRAWLDGDVKSGDRLIRRHMPTVHRFFRTKIPSEADDLAQKTFMVCFEHRERLHDASTPRAFLMGIARKVLLSFFRDLGRAPSNVPLTDSSILQIRTSASGVLARQEGQSQVVQALQSLPLDHQIALELRYWEDLSQNEIAEVLETTTGTVKSRLHRARERLRDLLPDGALDDRD